VPPAHKLLAPTLLRSQTLSALHEAVHRGEIMAEVADRRLARIQSMSIRLSVTRSAPRGLSREGSCSRMRS
jgi:hypothetical protein